MGTTGPPSPPPRAGGREPGAGAGAAPGELAEGRGPRGVLAPADPDPDRLHGEVQRLAGPSEYWLACLCSVPFT